jgi:hypothetical protein
MSIVISRCESEPRITYKRRLCQNCRDWVASSEGSGMCIKTVGFQTFPFERCVFDLPAKSGRDK